MKETNFKHTDIGLIPSDWDVKELGEMLTICNGKDYKHLPKGNIPVYGTGGKIAEVDDYLYDGESICIGRKGTIDKPQYHNGKIWTVDTLFYTKIFGAYPLFLYSKTLMVDWLSINEATGVPSLTSKNISKIRISIPPTLDEQRRIAEALQNIDQLLDAMDAQIAKKQAIKTGAMQQLLTSKCRLNGFTEKWKSLRLEDMCHFGKGKGLKKEYLTEDGKYKCILYGEIFTKYDTVIKCVFSKTNIGEGTFSKQGDVLMPGSTTTVGIDLVKAVSLNEDDVLLGGDIIILRPKEHISSKFLAYLISNIERNKVADVTQGITIIHLHAKNMTDISYLIPPTFEEQEAIAEVLFDMDSEIHALQDERNKYALIKQGMMQELLTGKTRI